MPAQTPSLKRDGCLFFCQAFLHLFSNLLKFCLVGNLAMPELEPVVIVARNYVNMAVHDFLAGCRLVVYMDIDSVGIDRFTDSKRHLLSGQVHARPCLSRNGIDIFKMILWQDEGMSWLYGLDVEECDGFGVLVNLVGGDRSCDYLAENAVCDRVV